MLGVTSKKLATHNLKVPQASLSKRFLVFQKLFRIEAGLKIATTNEKYQVRQQESIPLLAALKNSSINP
jgi:hypothetical protein